MVGSWNIRISLDYIILKSNSEEELKGKVSCIVDLTKQYILVTKIQEGTFNLPEANSSFLTYVPSTTRVTEVRVDNQDLSPDRVACLNSCLPIICKYMYFTQLKKVLFLENIRS